MRLKNSIRSIAIGSFDGVHIAHQRLIGMADAVAVIEKGRGYITHGYRRCDFIDKPIHIYHFEDIKSLSPREFILQLREDFPELDRIVVGYDFRFGYRKSGDVELLRELFSGEVNVVDEIKYRGLSIHSCLIREAIGRGSIRVANRLLNRPYRVEGLPIEGQGLGSMELVPTINIDVRYYTIPKSGVYITETLIGDEWLDSVTFIGDRESTDGKFAVETHILDRDIAVVDRYREIEILLHSRLRGNRRFDNLEDLKMQIVEDIDIARAYPYRYRPQ
ncbi:MAG: bifunctional riboflavin kinase/FAD synthetase [Epsilonproteobacteria bacterium]|nr:bifunctional riboflavin kinase/FAD synthetase [Campylobacterota bacterium]